MLHTSGANKKLREQVLNGGSISNVLTLLLNVSQFEYTLKKTIQSLLEQKSTRWNEFQTDAAGRMTELGEYFSGTKELTKVKPNKHLEKWFHSISDQVFSLSSHY